MQRLSQICMLMLLLLMTIPVIMSSLTSPSIGQPQYLETEVVHQWVKLDYDWKYDWLRDYYTERGWFNSSINLLSGLDVYKNDIYVTVIRLSKAVPSGLNKVVTIDGKSVLSPFPSFGTNMIGDCANLQFPFATHTDPNTGYMYIVDVGRIGRDPNVDAPCPPKLVVLDLNNKGAVVRRHDLPESVVLRHTNMVNDLVLDYGPNNSTQVRYVYITDTGNIQIVVFDLLTNQTWAFRDISMVTDADRVITINGVNYTYNVPVDGIAIDRDMNYVYYSAVGSRKLYQIPTSVLRNRSGNFAGQVRLVGYKLSNSDGMGSGRNGIYFGAGGLNALYCWPVAKDVNSQGVTEGQVTMTTQQLIAQNDQWFRWVDSMKLDTDGYLWFVSNRAPEFLAGTMDFTGAKGANFRINRVYVGDLPYLWRQTN